MTEERKNDPKKIQIKKEFIEGLNDFKKEIDILYNKSDYYTKLEEKKIGINLKLYNQKVIDVNEIRKELLKRGFDREIITENVTEEKILEYLNQYNEDSWSVFEELPSSDIEFIGATVRMNGYAVFKLDFINDLDYDLDYEDMSINEIENELDLEDINFDTLSLKSFSDWIENAHKSVLEGLSLEDYCSRFIEDKLVKTTKEIEAEEIEAKYEANRKFKEKKIPTNKYQMNGETFVKLWDGGTGFIEMDKVEFTSDSITGEELFENLNDGQFGVEKIIGARNVCVTQVYENIREYKDNGEIRKTEEKIVIYEGNISKKGKLNRKIKKINKGNKNNLNDILNLGINL